MSWFTSGRLGNSLARSRRAGRVISVRRLAERRMASLISAIERSMAASSSRRPCHRATGLDGGGEHLVADAVGGDAARWKRIRRRLPLQRQHGDVVAASPGLCAGRARPVRARRRTPAAGQLLRRCLRRSRLPHRPSEHSRSCRPAAGAPGPAMSKWLGGRAQAGEQHVAVDAVHAHHAGVAQLHVGVVARAGQQLAVAHQVQARIAAVRPVRSCPAPRRHQRGARRVEHALFAGVAQIWWWPPSDASCRKRRGRPAGAWPRAGTAPRWSAAPIAPPPRLQGARPCRRPAQTGPTRACSSSPCGLRSSRGRPRLTWKDRKLHSGSQTRMRKGIVDPFARTRLAWSFLPVAHPPARSWCRNQGASCSFFAHRLSLV
jgi:hypothetical protein